VADDAWVQNEFITTVQNRGGAIIAARKLSSAASAAQAIVDHMRDWVKGTPEVRTSVSPRGHSLPYVSIS
jgi:malate/lactate dehydrogenase